jgi:alkylhydroperoxidase family enzyme
VARLPYITPEESDHSERVESLYSEIRGMGRPLAHLYQVLANQPPALEAFMSMSRYVRDNSSLQPPLREIAILATAGTLHQMYEIAHHSPVAFQVGVTSEKIATIIGGGTRHLSPVELAVVTYARLVARERDVDDATFATLRSHFSSAELVDLVLTVAWYHLCAAVLGPLRVELEPNLPPSV